MFLKRMFAEISTHLLMQSIFLANGTNIKHRYAMQTFINSNMKATERGRTGII